MKAKILTYCLHHAYTYLPKHPQYNYYPHYSYIIQNNTLIEWGTNQEGAPPIHFGYNSQSRCPKLHSELVAYRKARGILNNEPFDMLNIRLNRQRQLRLSAPCSACQQWLASVGCRSVWFSTEDKFGKIWL